MESYAYPNIYPGSSEFNYWKCESMSIHDINAHKSSNMKHSIREIKDFELFSEKLREFKVKEAKKASLESCCYSTFHQYNKMSSRFLRYYTCEFHDPHTSVKWGRIFNKTWNLVDHNRVHTGEKPYVWHVCDNLLLKREIWTNTRDYIHQDNNLFSKLFILIKIYTKKLFLI